MLKILDKNSLFVLLFFLSVFLPSSALNFSKYMGVGIGLIIFALFLKIISEKNRFNILLDKYKIECLLFAGLGLDLLFSVFINLQCYENWTQFVLYGGATLFVMALLPLSYIIFSQLSVQGSALDDIHFQDTIWLGLALFILIHVLGILFFFLGPKMEPIYAYTVARDVLNGRTKSILNHYTTYGVISAITAIFSIAFMLSRKKKDRINILAILTLMVALMGGVFSSSRNFFWTLGVGCAVVSLQYIRSRKAVLVATSAMIGLIIIFHVVTIYVPAIGNRFDPYLPYLQQLRYGEPQIGHTPGSDLEGTGFEQRIKIWKTAISLWRHNPIIGIGPGVFRLKNTMSSDLNVHNVFLQMLTEGGIVGLIFFLVLIGRIIHRSWNHPSFPVFIAILAALLFDNFLDYSIPFVLCTTYMLAALDDYSGMEGRLS